MEANLCKCNKCSTVMIDQNPQKGAELHELTGTEVEMQYIVGIDDGSNDREIFWACPVCLTDEYLIDL